MKEMWEKIDQTEDTEDFLTFYQQELEKINNKNENNNTTATAKAAAKAKAKAAAKAPAKPKVVKQKLNQVAEQLATDPVATQTVIDKENLITKILKYQESSRFQDYIKKNMKISYRREQLSKMANHKLEAILYRIRKSLDSRGMDKMFEDTTHAVALGYEKILSNWYNIDGFSNLLMNNPAFLDALERYKIEKEIPDIPPAVMIMYIVSSTTLLAHSMSVLKETQDTYHHSSNMKPPSQEDIDLIEDMELIKDL
jgi:hypothetical protein